MWLLIRLVIMVVEVVCKYMCVCLGGLCGFDSDEYGI